MRKDEETKMKRKLEDTALDGAAIPFDPNDAEELGATPDDIPLKDVIEAAHDNEV